MMEGMKRALDTRKVDMRALKVASSTILTLAIMAPSSPSLRRVGENPVR